MYDIGEDLSGHSSSYGYYLADRKRLAEAKTAKRLHQMVSAEVQKEVARQEERFVNKVLDEIQFYFDTHTLNI